MRDSALIGELRPSQLLHTFGVGATVELPQLSTMVLGLDDWPADSGQLVSEPRLLAAVQARLGSQVRELRTPPRTQDSDVSPVGVPVSPFPRWLRCPVCRLLAPLESGLFKLRRDPYRPERTRYQHECTTRGIPPTAYPARFLLACRRGHLDDFPWDEFVHRGRTACGDTLRLTEFGTGGGPADVIISCDRCPASRRMIEAFGEKAVKERLPRCRGRHPHLGVTEPCEEPVRTIVLGASNSWFPLPLSALSIPTREGVVEQAVEGHWAILQKVPSAETLQFALDVQPQLANLRDFPLADVMAAIEARRRGDGRPASVDLRLPEWEVLSRPGSAPETPDFRVRRVAVPPRYAGKLADVVLVERLREVLALTGFTRVEAPDDVDDAGDPVPAARLSREKPRWVPCTEVRGEGLFLRLPTDGLSAWEQRYRDRGRAQALWRAHKVWRARRNLDLEGGWPGVRYVLLHSLAHALIRELALECGYGASSIRERIYAPRPDAPDMAGLLLYTAAPDSEGTLGGLVGLGEPDHLGRLLDQALDRARLCSADPLCSEHDPAADGSVHHAACHACQFASETSCERGNRFLDRAALVDTFTPAGTAYFEQA